MSGKSNSKLGRGFERLEARSLMAGNVFAGIVDGELRITGDGFSNDITVRNTGVIDEFEVVGNFSAGATTKINGGFGPFHFNNLDFSRDINVNLGGGDDRLFMAGADTGWGDLDAWDDLIIKTGSGNDSVFLRNMQTGGDGITEADVLIDLGTGANYLDARFIDVQDDFRVNTPDVGTNSGLKTRLDLRNLTVDDQLDIDLHCNLGIVNVVDSVCDDLLVDLYSGDDKLSVVRSRARVVDLDGGAGTDKLNLFSSSSAIHNAANRTAFLSPTASNIIYTS